MLLNIKIKQYATTHILVVWNGDFMILLECKLKILNYFVEESFIYFSY